MKIINAFKTPEFILANIDDAFKNMQQYMICEKPVKVISGITIAVNEPILNDSFVDDSTMPHAVIDGKIYKCMYVLKYKEAYQEIKEYQSISSTDASVLQDRVSFPFLLSNVRGFDTFINNVFSSKFKMGLFRMDSLFIIDETKSVVPVTRTFDNVFSKRNFNTDGFLIINPYTEVTLLFDL